MLTADLTHLGLIHRPEPRAASRPLGRPLEARSPARGALGPQGNAVDANDHAAGPACKAQCRPARLGPEGLWTGIALVLILAAAALIRAPGILDGLPFIYDPDEFNRYNRVLGMIAEYRLNPEWFGHPASTVIYPIWALFAGLYLIGRTLHWYANVPGFIEHVAQDPSVLVAGARTLMLGYSLALVYAVFLLGRVFGRTAAFSAAAVTAVSPLLVVNGTLIRSSDIVMVLFGPSRCCMPCGS